MMSHPLQWKQLHAAYHNQRIPQSMLFVGPLHCRINEFTTELMQLFLCKDELTQPCLNCIDCKLAKQTEHPDVQWLRPEKAGGAIKIDQIRELQSTAYLTPQRSNHRIIIIEAADRMNSASANALLKILEEPASHTVFILLAQQIGTVLPTVLSRCQVIPFTSSENLSFHNLLALGACYPAESDRALIIDKSEFILDGLIELIQQRQHPCLLVAEWSQFELSTLLWFLYLVYSQLQYMRVHPDARSELASSQLSKLLTILNPVVIFNQIDKINTILRKLSHNMNVNNILVLEDMLLSLTKTL